MGQSTRTVRTGRRGCHNFQEKLSADKDRGSQDQRVPSKDREIQADQASFLECQENIQSPLSLDYCGKERREISRGIRILSIWPWSYSKKRWALNGDDQVVRN